MIDKISKQLKIDKPLIMFDLETTGLALSIDRIVEIAYIKIMPNGRVQKDDIFINPEMKISEEAVEVHGITDEDVAQMPTFKEKAKELIEIFNDCYFGGFNIVGFDLPMLKREFLRAGINFDYKNSCIIDSKVIYNYMEPRTLSAAYKYYCQKEHVDAHSAIADVEATLEILSRQIEFYNEVMDMNFIFKIHKELNDRYVDNERKFYWRNGEAHFSFSKHKDDALRDVAERDPDFLKWILSADFSDETKDIVKKALEGEMPKKNCN